MKALTPILLVLPMLALFTPVHVPADGMFVVPKFVWDKHKDINEPMQKAIIVYDAGTEDLILQVKYEGPANEFGWLIPAPSLPTVQDGSMKCFYELSQFTQQKFERWTPVGRTRGILDTMSLNSASAGIAQSPQPVKVVEIKTIGSYKIAVLSTTDSDALEKWLDENHFYFPATKSDVIEDYVRQHWYFIAVKINLGSAWGSLFSPSTSEKLAAGELNPLQISFASERCIFPLKISSGNGKPSEVQLYVLSPDPLLERGMLEKKLPLVYSNDVARAERGAAQMEQIEVNNWNLRMRLRGVNPAPPFPAEMRTAIESQGRAPVANPDDLLPYAKVTESDLPDTSSLIPCLKSKSWWLTKQTWTFKPEEMRDLLFEPAIPCFADLLGTKYGYFAVESLTHFDADAVPAFLAAFQSTNPATRVNAAYVFDRHYGSPHDPRLTAAAVTWLKDSEPSVRIAGIEVLSDYSNWNPASAKPLIAMLRDPDPGVRHEALWTLPRHSNDFRQYEPQVEELLNDPDPDIQHLAEGALYSLDRSKLNDLVAGRSFHDRGCAEYDMQQFALALADFRRACELGSDVTDYSACRLWLVQTRLGDRDAATRRLNAYLQQHENGTNDGWSLKIARYFAGGVTEAGLLQAAIIPGAESAQQQQCEAYFYIGAKDLLGGNKIAALDNFKKCNATGVIDFQEYHSAAAESANLSAYAAAGSQ